MIQSFTLKARVLLYVNMGIMRVLMWKFTLTEAFLMQTIPKRMKFITLFLCLIMSLGLMTACGDVDLGANVNVINVEKGNYLPYGK